MTRLDQIKVTLFLVSKTKHLNKMYIPQGEIQASPWNGTFDGFDSRRMPSVAASASVEGGGKPCALHVVAY